MSNLDRNAKRLTTYVESLERRQLLAGNVTATITGAGDLVINGDSGDNLIGVFVHASGAVDVVGYDGTTVDDFGLAGSQISGDIRINLKGGDDDLHFSGAMNDDVPVDDVRVVGGSGNDTIYMSYLSGITGNVNIVGGAGNDDIRPAYLNFAGDLTISTGGGTDLASVFGSVAEEITINTGSDVDRVRIAYSTSEGRITISAGSGENGIALHGVESNGPLTIRSGGGADQININAAYTVNGSDLVISSGGGDDAIEIQNSVVTGKLDMKTSGGNDTADVKYSQLAASKVNTGSGNDALSFFESDAGALNLVMAGGNDALSLINTTGNGSANGSSGSDGLSIGGGGGLSLDDANFETFA